MGLHADYLHIPGLLDISSLAQIDKISAHASYADGRSTAYDSAKDVKNNLQLDARSQEYQQVQQVLLSALNQNPVFRNAVLPQHVYPFLVSKYQAGMKYGWHVDSPIMGNMMRTDVAMTVFLNSPDEYDGGELELQTSLGNAKFKLNKGDAICYPCTHVHQVNEVTGGIRHVAVTWIQSIIKSAEQRKLLFELYQVMDSLRQKNITGEEFNLLQQNYSNLLRMWAY
jgi:PKHD-type hydroxylase